MREKNFLLIQLLFGFLKHMARNRRKIKTFERILPVLLNKKANDEFSMGKAYHKGKRR